MSGTGKVYKRESEYIREGIKKIRVMVDKPPGEHKEIVDQILLDNREEIMKLSSIKYPEPYVFVNPYPMPRKDRVSMQGSKKEGKLFLVKVKGKNWWYDTHQLTALEKKMKINHELEFRNEFQVHLQVLAALDEERKKRFKTLAKEKESFEYAFEFLTDLQLGFPEPEDYWEDIILTDSEAWV